MNNSLYVIATILVVTWCIAYFGFHPSSSIHILLAMAALILILRGIAAENPMRHHHHNNK